MRICIPVSKDKGLDSKVYGHFGSAPVFIIFESDNGSTFCIGNNDLHHAHGACNPLKALDNQKVDAVIVGGIGAGALSRLNKSGIKVFHAVTTTAKENIELLKAQSLPEFELKHCCTGHQGLKAACKHY